MSETAPELKVIYQGETLPEKPKVRFWHWIFYYAYNLARKPKVWRLKREQDEIYKVILNGLEHEIFPNLHLYGMQRSCSSCRHAYVTLKGQIYISVIRMILQNMRCEDHPRVYDDFLHRYSIEFNRNEEIAAEINGFAR